MNPEKSREQELRNQIDIFARENAELKARLTAEHERKVAKAAKKEKRVQTKILAKNILRNCLWGLLITASVAIVSYCLVWLFEPLKMETYQGRIIAIQSIRKDAILSSADQCKITKKNGKLEYRNCDASSAPKNIIEYHLEIAFLDGDSDLQRLTFSTESEQGWFFAWNQAKLPFPENSKNNNLYTGDGNPYVGCEVEVYDLRGRWLNSNSTANFVANASMCKKPAASQPEK